MTEPVWLSLAEILYIHEQSIAGFGGLDGLRDEGLLQSAIARPQQLFSYGEPPPDLADLAAALATGLAKNHPFLDGNKRTAFMAAAVFLSVNGLYLDATEAEAEEMMVAVASGSVEGPAFAAWLRERSRSLPA
ncbi:type II toxin-antitoxin system death-on-curing family toxin [Oceanibaculum pacificum]|uniref:Death-on-curing protein n=1 Tax=Oceanibaculum pacificum TaxID=580166 RepID=A0A154VUJ5_9PROT|nr:type II toxin-antitoxin system death-on-curing family toxin [Oceanibaculum pacificum]KZD04878.1 death-on-curing protein [Oceanibaculum pacificum]